MFGDILKTIIEIFISSPDAFIEVTNRLVEYIIEHKLLGYIFAISITFILFRFFIESDSFAFVASFMQLLTITTIAYILLVNWVEYIPNTGLSIGNELVSVVIDPDDKDELEKACGSDVPQQSQNPDIKDESEDLRNAACHLGNKVQEAVDNLTTPITTSIDVPDEDDDDEDSLFGFW